jgi:anhydro-N-acetylmuramic acid kinase
MVYHVAGLMSGSSLDGLDLAFCSFSKNGNKWSHTLHHGVTVPFSAIVQVLLEHAHELSAEKLASFDSLFGSWCGEKVAEEAVRVGFTPMLIGSHGHTVQHQPSQGFTHQIGRGEVMAKASGFPVVHDFRSADIYLGGQGAPLVPVGDRLLYSEYDACLNLGGIANISFQLRNKQKSYDICPVNQLLNHLAGREELSYDRDGTMAARGQLLPALSAELDAITYYEQSAPKSLSREMVEKHWLSLLDSNVPTADLMHTVCDHIARQIGKSTEAISGKRVLVTGGGAFNLFLIDQIKKYSSVDLVIPDEDTINFKEAIVFGFLGLLRWLEFPNVYGSATGAKRNHCSGSISLP